MSQFSDDRTTEELFVEEERSTPSEPGDGVSVQSVVASEEDEFEWIKTPLVNRRFVLKHPRVILSFLRFIDEYNELADADEVHLLPAIPQRIIQGILSHPSVVNPPQEFVDDINEFRQRLERHMDLSELQQDQPLQH